MNKYNNNFIGSILIYKYHNKGITFALFINRTNSKNVIGFHNRTVLNISDFLKSRTNNWLIIPNN